MIGCRFLPIIFTELRNDYFPTIYSKIENKSHHIPEYKLGNKDSVIPFNQPSSSYSKVHTFSTIPNYIQIFLNLSSSLLLSSIMCNII